MARPNLSPSMMPVGEMALALTIVVRRSSMERPMFESFSGSAEMRIAGWSAPATLTSATPSICEMRCTSTESAAS